MTTSIIYDTSITSLYSFTSEKADQLNKIPYWLTVNTKAGTLPESSRPQLTNLHITNLTGRLKQLNASICEYANLCFIWKIIGLFTGTFCIYKRLQRSLPIVMAQVNELAQRLNISNNPKNSQPPITRPSQPPAPPQPTPAIYRPQPSRPPLPPRVKGPPAFLTKAERIERKIKLITAASELVSDTMRGHRAAIKANPNSLPPDIQIAFKVEQFFSKTLEKLCNGEDAPLPRWFHSTKNDFVYSIVQQKKILQRNAVAGFGAYLSTCNETHWYGPWTFAMDEKELEGSEGYFFPAEHQYHPGYMYPALWVRVLKDLPITSESVAFMVAAAANIDVLRKQVLEPLQLNVDVMTIEQAQAIYMYLELADVKRRCPSNQWDPNTADPSGKIYSCQLPDNMRNRSWPLLPSTPNIPVEVTP